MTEKKVIKNIYNWHQKNDDKVNIDEIIGIVKTDEPTNSVQLKKEAQLSICEKRLIELKKENEQLQQELFESEEERLMIDYSDNPVRRDANIELLKEYFKKRFGRDFE